MLNDLEREPDHLRLEVLAPTSKAAIADVGARWGALIEQLGLGSIGPAHFRRGHGSLLRGEMTASQAFDVLRVAAQREFASVYDDDTFSSWPDHLCIALRDGGELNFYFDFDGGLDRLGVGPLITCEEPNVVVEGLFPTGGRTVTALARVAELARAFADTALFARVFREPVDTSCFPATAFETHHVLVVSPAAVAGAFRDVEEWMASWDAVETVGERWLAHRALTAATNLDFLRSIAEGQWRLIRAAKAGMNWFDNVDARDGLGTVYADRPRSLRLVSSDSDALLYVLVEPDRHICGFEISELEEAVIAGRTTRVVVPTVEVARREARPLYDVGAVVAVGTCERWHELPDE